jgi:hypothetical protein
MSDPQLKGLLAQLVVMQKWLCTSTAETATTPKKQCVASVNTIAHLYTVQYKQNYTLSIYCLAKCKLHDFVYNKSKVNTLFSCRDFYRIVAPETNSPEHDRYRKGKRSWITITCQVNVFRFC